MENKLLDYSLQYLLIGISESYSRLKLFRNIEQFNNENNINKIFVSCYPFFISTVNDYGPFLFKLFGDFYLFQYGPYSDKLDKLILSLEFKSKKFEFIHVHDSKLFIESDSFEGARNSILNSKIGDKKFSDIVFPYVKNYSSHRDLIIDSIINESEVNYIELYKAIDNGIEFFDKTDFFDCKIETAKFNCIYYKNALISMQQILGGFIHKTKISYERHQNSF